VTVRVPGRSRRDEAEEIVNANLKPMMEEMLRNVGAKMRAARTPLNRHDLEAAYNEAWHGVTEHIIKGRPVTSLAGLLFTMMHRRAQDIYISKKDSRRVEMDLEQQAIDGDLAAQVDDQEMLTRLLGRLKDRLNDKERRAVTLCLLHGYTRPEAADLLGIDRVVFERIMDGASRKMAGIVASLEARGCGGDEWSRMMRAYALGLLTEEDRDYHKAMKHLDGPGGCEACRRYVRGLRGLAAVLPPLFPPGLLEGHDATHVLSHLARWLGGGHGAGAATAGAAGAGAAGAGAGAATAGAGGGTAVGVAVGGTKALLLAGAAALSIAGAAAVVVAKHAGGSPRRPIAHGTGTLRSASREAQRLTSAFPADLLPRTTAAVRHPGSARHRQRTVAEFTSTHPVVTRQSRKPEFTWERPPSDRTSGRAPTATTATTPAPLAPPPPEETHHKSESSAEEGRNFSFEK
jgi:DNA-directed RNA polymerase specialized sigma24 family protein